MIIKIPTRVGLLTKVLFFTFLMSISSCAEPANTFFDTAVLNTNTITDFGTPLLAKHISDETTEFADIPSSKKKGDEAEKYVQNNILFMEKSLTDIKALTANEASRKLIKEQSIGLYEFVIPVYKKEYTAFAKLCDTKAPQGQKDEIIKLIEQKYNAEFERRYAELLVNAKAFAAGNQLHVDWK